MIEQTGDIWEARQPGDWVTVTTNGTLRRDGCLVMGRGIAKEASVRYPQVQKDLGFLIRTNGLRLEVLHSPRLIAFPVKFEFYQKANLNLILKSTLQLLEKVAEKIGPGGDIFQLQGRILMPRPGCGNGKLDWAEVEPMLRHYLTSDRFVVFNK